MRRPRLDDVARHDVGGRSGRGSASALGRIASLVAAELIRGNPLQRRLTSLSWVSGAAALAPSMVALMAGLLRRGLGEMVITAISLTVAAVPESLPAVRWSSATGAATY